MVIACVHLLSCGQTRQHYFAFIQGHPMPICNSFKNMWKHFQQLSWMFTRIWFRKMPYMSQKENKYSSCPWSTTMPTNLASKTQRKLANNWKLFLRNGLPTFPKNMSLDELRKQKAHLPHNNEYNTFSVKTNNIWILLKSVVNTFAFRNKPFSFFFIWVLNQTKTVPSFLPLLFSMNSHAVGVRINICAS